MPALLETLQAEVLRLSPSDRAQLLERLIASLDVDPDTESLWDAVAAQREESLAADGETAIPLSLALAKLEARFCK